MRGAVPPLHQYVFMAWCLVKHRDNFALLLPPRAHGLFMGTAKVVETNWIKSHNRNQPRFTLTVVIADVRVW